MTAPANTATWFASATAPGPATAPMVEVRLDGAPEPRLRLAAVEHRLGGVASAHLAADLGRDVRTGETVRLEDLAGRIRPGAAVRATLLRTGAPPGTEAEDLVLFDGRVARVRLALSAEGERLEIEAEDPAADLLRRRVGGRCVRTATGAVRLQDRRLVFNPDGRPNASPDLYDPGTGDPYTVFAAEAGSGAAAWTLAEAVAYLLAEHGAGSAVAVPPPSEVRAALPDVVLEDVALEGRTLAEALEALLALAGARPHVRVEPGTEGVSRRLEALCLDRGPAAWLSHQPPGETYDPGRTDLAALEAERRFALAPRRYVARGDRRLYESTFDLVPGWPDALATTDPDDFSPRTNPDFETVRDVFRKWVLNEAGDYSAAPYDRGPAPDLSSLFEGAPTVARRRRLLPCLSRDGLGRSRGVWVEISLDGGSTWQQLSMAARVLESECGIYLSEDPLPPDYLAAAMRGEVRVRATATIESDACLEAAWPETDEDAGRPGRTRYLHVPAGYRYRKVAPTSRFYGAGDADEADDSARLADLVRTAWEADARSPAPARVTVPGLALGHRVGERILGVRGRPLALADDYEGFVVAPTVRRVRWVLLPVPQTELDLE